MYQQIVRDEWQRFCNSTVVLDTRWIALLNREHMNAAPDDLNQILEDLRRFRPRRRHSATSHAGLPAVRGQLARKPEVPLDAFKKSIQTPRELFQMCPAHKPESAVVQ